MLDPIERFLEAEVSPAAAPAERVFYDLWHEHSLGKRSPIEQAIVGALLADRLPWVFAAGYQATLRNAFATPQNGWAAFAATEDVHDPDAHPGTVLSGDGTNQLLNGHKSWVAHSELVDHLIITINDPGGDKRRARGVMIERGRKGVSITHRSNPGFLGAMSQGFVALHDTPVSADEIFEFEPIRQFGRTEAKFVTLAGVAFLLARTEEASALQDRLIALAGGFIALLQEAETSRQTYAALDRGIPALRRRLRSADGHRGDSGLRRRPTAVSHVFRSDSASPGICQTRPSARGAITANATA